MYEYLSKTPLIAELIKFIESQPADRPIKSHRSWNECAVGDFFREVKNHEIPLAYGSMPNYGEAYDLMHSCPVYQEFARQLQEHSVLSEVMETPDQPNCMTYGTFIEKLRAAIADDIESSNLHAAWAVDQAPD